MENERITREQSVSTMSKSMLIVMIFTMVSKVTGFLRETVLASQYGRTMVTDAFKTAQDLPCIFLSIIVTALSATLIPAYSGQLKESREKANRFINNLFTIGMIFSVIVLIITGLFMDQLVGFVTREAEDPAVRQLTIQLAQMMLPMGIFVFLARITSAYLQANFRFTIPALSQLFLNLTVIGSIMVSRGTNITYVAIGTVLGWALTFVVQLPSLRRTGLAYRPVIDMKDPGIREVLTLMIPVLVSSTFDQLYIIFDRMVAYRGAVGDPSALDYANRVSTMVSAVLLTTVATVLYPNLVRHVDNRDKFADNLSFGINLNLLIALPATAAMILLRVPITRIVYERGMFTAEDTLLTSTLLACYCAGIFGVGMRELCNRCFYAYKDTVIPTIVGVGVVLLNLGLNYLLHAMIGVAGIAAATAISSLASGFVLLFLLYRKHHVLEGKRILRCLWKTALATALMIAVLVLLSSLLNLNALAGMSLLLMLGITCVIGVLVYFVVLKLLRLEELSMLMGAIGRRFRRKAG
ncbi:murein biosynthesis integral membrane protein MurJ [Eubacteriales bacterium OttesenSCG-928-A19]|nr:murein biosynthesis integral membrane protein MurJ [Eubacteriales bacterium OttesenSCG-928-A19]